MVFVLVAVGDNVVFETSESRRICSAYHLGPLIRLMYTRATVLPQAGDRTTLSAVTLGGTYMSRPG